MARTRHPLCHRESLLQHGAALQHLLRHRRVLDRGAHRLLPQRALRHPTLLGTIHPGHGTAGSDCAAPTETTAAWQDRSAHLHRHRVLHLVNHLMARTRHPLCHRESLLQHGAALQHLLRHRRVLDRGAHRLLPQRALRHPTLLGTIHPGHGTAGSDCTAPTDTYAAWQDRSAHLHRHRVLHHMPPQLGILLNNLPQDRGAHRLAIQSENRPLVKQTLLTNPLENRPLAKRTLPMKHVVVTCLPIGYCKLQRPRGSLNVRLIHE